ncbi:hypothetical protein Sj15T_18980 [Sphingobium sp. TA15]|nr:hypothetical protein Sj15T_18980 [Sphingobium sp. TA15]
MQACGREESLHIAPVPEAERAVPGNDDMIMHPDLQVLADPDQSSREFNVCPARLGRARGMIVGEEEPWRSAGYGMPHKLAQRELHMRARAGPDAFVGYGVASIVEE